MPKLKTRKLLKRRLRVTKNGKILFNKPGRRHLMSGKSGKKRRQLRRVRMLTGRLARKLSVAMGGPAKLTLRSPKAE